MRRDERCAASWRIAAGTWSSLWRVWLACAIAFAAIGSLLGAQQADGACPECPATAATPCPAHETRVRAAVEKAAAEFKTAAWVQRKELLGSVALLTTSHASRPSATVAKFLGSALADAEFEVRREALRRLLEGQEPAATVDALVSGVPSVLGAWKGVDARLTAMSKATANFEDNLMAPHEVRNVTSLVLYADDEFRALGKVPDERCRRALAEVLEWPVARTPGRFYVSACLGLLDQGSQESVRAVVEFLPGFERAVRLGKTGPRYPDPNSWHSFIDVMHALYRAGASADVDAIDKALTEFATVRGVAPGPGSADWKAWFAKHKKLLPAKLGTVAAPVHATLPEIAADKARRK